MRLKAYQTKDGWCCTTCHATVFECQCHPGDYFEYRYDPTFRISGISHWMFRRYGCDYDSWILRLRRACVQMEFVFMDGFQCDALDMAERTDGLIHLMRIKAKPRKDISEALVEVLPKLTGKQRQVLTLWMDGKPHRQIGATVGVSEPNSRKLAERAQMKIRAAMN